MKRGFIASLIAAIFAVMLITFGLIVFEAERSFDNGIRDSQPLAYSEMFFDDVGKDVAIIVGEEIRYAKKNQSLNVTIKTRMPISNFSPALTSYGNFIRNNASSLFHANVMINSTGITDGTLEIYMLGRYLYLHNYSNASRNEVTIMNMGGHSDTNATSYLINVSVNRYRKTDGSMSFVQNGDLNITVIYSDFNGTIKQSGNVSRQGINSMTIEYSGNETIFVSVGRVEAPGAGELMIKDNGANPNINIVATFPADETITKRSEYNATMNYSQGKIFKNGMVEG